MSMYDSRYTNMTFYNWAQQYPELGYGQYSITPESGTWRVPMTMPEVPSYTQMSVAPASAYKEPTTEPATLTPETTINLLSPEIQQSISDYYKGLGKQTTENAKYFERANVANKINAAAQIASSALGLLDTYSARDSVRLTNRELDKQKSLIDLNLTNQEALATSNFRNAIADLQVITAAKNVDIRSQAVRSDIVQGGEDLGQDLADARLQGNLAKRAIDFQKAMNNAQQRKNEQQAWINFGANALNSMIYLI